MSHWLARLFDRRPPRHVAYVPNPAYTLAEACVLTRLPVVVRVLSGTFAGIPIQIRTADVTRGLN